MAEMVIFAPVNKNEDDHTDRADRMDHLRPVIMGTGTTTTIEITKPVPLASLSLWPPVIPPHTLGRGGGPRRPRYERDLALGYHTSSGLGVLFDTGSSYSSMPQNLWQKCQELGYKMTFIDKKTTVWYIDDTQIHYDSECNIVFLYH